MYSYPTHYECRYEHPLMSYECLHKERPTRYVTTRYYIANPYISSYTDGRYELLRRSPIYTELHTYTEDLPHLSRASRATSRASSIPPRATSLALEAPLRSARASSVPPADTCTSVVTYNPSIVRYTPKLHDSNYPAITYSYYRPPPTHPNEISTRTNYNANPVSFGPSIYTNLSVFPTMRYSSYSLLTPINRYRYRASPFSVSSYHPSRYYYSYPTLNRSTYSTYHPQHIVPSKFQINRVCYPSIERYYSGRPGWY